MSMPTAVECVRSGLDSRTCACCLGLDDRPDPAERSEAFEASYPGLCVTGGDRIAAGEQIVAVADGGYAHVDCI